MKKTATFLILILTTIACSEPSTPRRRPAKNPISVRGFFVAVDMPNSGDTVAVTSPEIEQARLEQIFYEANLTVDDVPYASGGIQTNGSFIALDVPPGDSDIAMQFPGIETPLKLSLRGIPPSADVFIPSLAASPEGIRLLEPEKIRIRVPSNAQTGVVPAEATVMGTKVEVRYAKVSEMSDRRDFPTPPGAGMNPVATVK